MKKVTVEQAANGIYEVKIDGRTQRTYVSKSAADKLADKYRLRFLMDFS